MDELFELHRREGGYDRHLVYFIIQRGICFSIIKSLLMISQTKQINFLNALNFSDFWGIFVFFLSSPNKLQKNRHKTRANRLYQCISYDITGKWFQKLTPKLLDITKLEFKLSRQTQRNKYCQIFLCIPLQGCVMYVYFSI